MPASATAPTRKLLDPVDRVSEIVFGVIMALTFTCTLSVAGSGHEEIRTMMIGALGCNLAWGLVDGFMFLLANFVERGRGLRILHAVRGSPDAASANAILLDALPPVAAQSLRPEQVDDLRRSLQDLNDVPLRPGLKKRDWLGALAICLLVFASTFPIVIPFMAVRDPAQAVRLSNAVAVLLLFGGGFALGRHASHRPWLMGLTLALGGAALVAVTIALGG